MGARAEGGGGGAVVGARAECKGEGRAVVVGGIGGGGAVAVGARAERWMKDVHAWGARAECRGEIKAVVVGGGGGGGGAVVVGARAECEGGGGAGCVGARAEGEGGGGAVVASGEGCGKLSLQGCSLGAHLSQKLPTFVKSTHQSVHFVLQQNLVVF